jgi:DNA-binding NarL/FixJ family response regulator
MPQGDLKLVGVVDRVDGVSTERLSGVALPTRTAATGAPGTGFSVAQRTGTYLASGTATGARIRRPEQAVRLLLAYRHTLLRQALRHLLTAQGDIEVLAEVSDGKDAVEKAEKLRPDVVLLDLALPILDGIEATRLIKRRVPNAKVILLTLGASDEDVVRALQAGISGCLVKDADATELALAIAAVQRGASYLSPAISDRVVQNYLRPGEGGAHFEIDPLSVREREVLQLIADGLSNQEIAGKLYLSVKTVEAHKAHIMRKLNIRGRTELIKYAIRKGLITIDG